MEPFLWFIFETCAVEQDEVLNYICQMESTTLLRRMRWVYLVKVLWYLDWSPFSCGSNLAINVFQCLIEQIPSFRRLVSRQENGLANIRGTEHGQSFSLASGRHNGSTYCPSRYQGLMREKSVLRGSFGSLFRLENTNLVQAYQYLALDSASNTYLNMLPVLHG